MWKRIYLVTLILSTPILSKFSPNHVINRILNGLSGTLNYISENHNKINVDCLFGVILASAILDDTVTYPGPYQEQAKALKIKTQEIYIETAPLMKKQPTWEHFAKYVVTPELWKKSLKYKLAEFRMVYAMKSKIEALFSTKTYENYTEGLSDFCLSSVINNTLALKPKTICRLSPKCEQFVGSLEKGAGYILTHKLLLLQVARVRKCKMHPKILATAIKKVCCAIFTEIISVEYFVGLDDIFDLFLEQSLLCGYEGFADFLRMEWLDKILAIQHGSGCFPVNVETKTKRETNEWKDGCADHTTGLALFSNSNQISELVHQFDKVCDFTLSHYEEINFDGLLGFTIAEAQLLQIRPISSEVMVLLRKCEEIRLKIAPILSKTPKKMPILEKFLLNPQNWINHENFIDNSLTNLGIYQNWTIDDITEETEAVYKGVYSDHCLMEILNQNCYISPFCYEMMLAPRIDRGYLLTHRLLYLQIIRLKRCFYNSTKFRVLTTEFCSLILREARTNYYWGFPVHDIALEQMVLCGIEGYTEFLNENWKREVSTWQTPFGCYKSKGEVLSKRSSNVISFGCSDHTTGLGAAALALHLRFQMKKINFPDFSV